MTLRTSLPACVVALAAALFAAAGALATMDTPRTLSWDDLLPEGEEEVLEELYAEFYATLQQNMEPPASATDLDEFGDDGFGGGFDDWSNDPSGAAQIMIGPGGGVQIAEGSALDFMPQIGTFNVVEELNGERVRLPGYVVPLDFNAESAYQEFLLVPYFGACLHAPPPPPNQVVFVTAETAVEVKDIYLPVWVEGVMATSKSESELADTAYTLALSDLELFNFD